MNPYECDPARIPPTDQYAEMPLYGRYAPNEDDFRPDLTFTNWASTDALSYWASILALCTENNCIRSAAKGGRDAFALGTVIVKSSHLHPEKELDWTFADANECAAIDIAKTKLPDIKVPTIHFAGKVNGRQLLVQERLAGVSLNIALPYLTNEDKDALKTQTKDVIRRLRTARPPSGTRGGNTIAPDPRIRYKRHIMTGEEVRLIFDLPLDFDTRFMHNNLTEANIIVDDGQVVGIIGWRRAGYIGQKTAAEIHRRVRLPQLNARLSEDMVWGYDLYD